MIMTAITYVFWAIFYGAAVGAICVVLAYVFGLNVADMASGGVFLGLILGLSFASESRKPRPLWHRYMKD